MILHDAIKTIKNKVFPFSLKKKQNLVSFQKTKKTGLGCFFFKKPGFFSTLGLRWPTRPLLMISLTKYLQDPTKSSFSCAD